MRRVDRRGRPRFDENHDPNAQYLKRNLALKRCAATPEPVTRTRAKPGAVYLSKQFTAMESGICMISGKEYHPGAQLVLIEWKSRPHLCLANEVPA